MAAFGWSAGDIVATIQLVAKVSTALKEVGGASEEYIRTIQDLQALEIVLRHLQNIEPNGSDLAKINAICATSETSRRALRELLDDFAKFEKHLGKSASRGWYRGTHRKAQWALFASKEVKKLQDALGMQFKTIMFLLQCQQLSAAGSTQEALGQSTHRQELVAQDLKNRFLQMSQSVSTSEREISQKLEAISNSIRDSAKDGHNTSLLAQNEARLQSRVVISMLTEIQSAIENVDLRGSLQLPESNPHGQKRQLLHQEINPQSYQSVINGLIENAHQLFLLVCLSIRASVQRALSLYSALLIILQIGCVSIVRNPTKLLSSSIYFTDALGRSIHLDQSIFKSWSIFNRFLLDRFEDHPGEQHIRRGKFLLFHRNNPGRFISEDEWSNEATPGAELSMSIGLTQIWFSGHRCPRRSCGASAVPGRDSQILEFGRERVPCGTSMCSGFVDVFDRVASSVCRTCGSRSLLDDNIEGTVMHEDDGSQFVSPDDEIIQSMDAADEIVLEDTSDKEKNDSSSATFKPTMNNLGDNPLGANGLSMTKGAQLSIVNAKQKRLENLRASMEAMNKTSKAISIEKDLASEQHEIEALQWVHLVHSDEPKPEPTLEAQERGLTTTTAAQRLLQARLQLLKQVHSFSKATTEKRVTDGPWALDSTSELDASLFETGSVLQIQEDDATVNWHRDSPLHHRLGRLFVVVQNVANYRVCLRISTYQGLATTESHIDSSKHALIYFEGSKPICFAEERALLPSIMITSDHLFQSLDLMSRLSFAKVYNIRLSTPVKCRGTILGTALHTLEQNFKHCFKKNYDLSSAAKAGSRAKVLGLLSNGADPNAIVGVHGNALFEAVRAGHPGVAELLLAYGAIPYLGLAERLSSSPLYEALVRDHRRLVKAIVERSICSNCYQQPNQRCLIQRAVMALAACEEPLVPFDLIHKLPDAKLFENTISGFCHQMWPLLVFLPAIDIGLHRLKVFNFLKIYAIPITAGRDELKPVRKRFIPRPQYAQRVADAARRKTKFGTITEDSWEPFNTVYGQSAAEVTRQKMELGTISDDSWDDQFFKEYAWKGGASEPESMLYEFAMMDLEQLSDEYSL